MKRLRLDNPTAIRHSLSRVANMVLNDELDPKKGNTIISAANVILASIKTDELEKRIDSLEETIEGYEDAKYKTA